MLLEGKVAIVSGIGPGMGRDISLRFAREGADLVLAARSPDKLAALADEVRALGRTAITVPTDIARPEQCRALAERAGAELGRIDVLVNNAFHAGTFKAFESDDIDDGWRRTLDVNLFGTLQLTQAVLPAMKKQGGGSIVMINSMVLREVGRGFAAYGASKAALHAATRGLAGELGRHQIRVNSVLPGYIWGPAVRAGFELQAKAEGRTPEECKNDVVARIPLGRIPDSEEISGAVLFFASELSSCITGASLDANGGMFMP